MLATRMLKSHKTLVCLALIASSLAFHDVCLALDGKAGFKEGLSQFDHADYLHARNCFERSIAEDSNNPIYHYYLGVTLEKLGNHVKAAEQYQKCLELKPAAGLAGNCEHALSTYRDKLTDAKAQHID